jgi:hypothetical protein
MAATEELLEAVISVRSVPKIYNEQQLRLRERKYNRHLAVVKLTTVQVTKLPL